MVVVPSVPGMSLFMMESFLAAFCFSANRSAWDKLWGRGVSGMSTWFKGGTWLLYTRLWLLW